LFYFFPFFQAYRHDVRSSLEDIFRPQLTDGSATSILTRGGINRLNDRFAKYLLAGPKSKPVLTDFINGVLLLDETGKIIDLDIISGELIQDVTRMKLSILDVSAKLADGRTLDIEVQVVNHHDFKKRGPFYWAMRHVKKLESGMFYTQIKPTITICLLAFDLLEEEEAYRNSYSIRNDKSGNRLCEDMEIIYLELPKFLRRLGEEHPRTGLERWLLYFSNEEGERMNKAVADNPALETAKEIEAVFWADAEEKEAYFQHQRLLMDEYSAAHTLEYLLAQAKEETAQAKEETAQAKEEAAQVKEEAARAEEKGVAKVARNLLEKDFDMEMIIQASGLTREEIEKLR
jgi:predicted transposase/invertase (TIGR01784 family)